MLRINFNILYIERCIGCLSISVHKIHVGRQSMVYTLGAITDALRQNLHHRNEDALHLAKFCRRIILD